MVYGPAQRDLRKLIPYSILSLLARRPLSLSSGRRPVDWIHVTDVVTGLLASAAAPGIEGDTVDIGSGVLVPIRTVVERLAALVDGGGDLNFGALAERPMEQVRIADTAESARKLGWRPTVSLEDGLSGTVAWYREQFEAGRVGPARMS